MLSPVNQEGQQIRTGYQSPVLSITGINVHGDDLSTPGGVVQDYEALGRGGEAVSKDLKIVCGAPLLANRQSEPPGMQERPAAK